MAAVPGTQLVLDTNMLSFTNTSPTAPWAATLFNLLSMSTEDFNKHLFVVSSVARGLEMCDFRAVAPTAGGCGYSVAVLLR